MWYVLRFEHAYGLKRYNDRRMISDQPTCSLGGTASRGLLLAYFILTIFIAVFPKAVAIFLFWAINSTLITVPCIQNVPSLLLQQLRCYPLPLDVW